MPVYVFIALIKNESCCNLKLSFPVHRQSVVLSFLALFDSSKPLFIFSAPSPHIRTQHPGLHELGV